jgi:hypothetical protein
MEGMEFVRAVEVGKDKAEAFEERFFGGHHTATVVERDDIIPIPRPSAPPTAKHTTRI